MRLKEVGQKWRPITEFVKSGLMFLYRSTNIFLEHLSNQGSEYSTQDFEHISITETPSDAVAAPTNLGDETETELQSFYSNGARFLSPGCRPVGGLQTVRHSQCEKM